MQLLKTSITLVFWISWNALGEPYNLFDTFEVAEATEFELFSGELMKEKKHPKKDFWICIFHVICWIIDDPTNLFLVSKKWKKEKKKTKDTFKETTKSLTEKGCAIFQKYPSGVLMTNFKDFHPLNSVSHRNSSIMQILVKPVLQEIPVYRNRETEHTDSVSNSSLLMRLSLEVKNQQEISRT